MTDSVSTSPGTTTEGKHCKAQRGKCSKHRFDEQRRLFFPSEQHLRWCYVCVWGRERERQRSIRGKNGSFPGQTTRMWPKGIVFKCTARYLFFSNTPVINCVSGDPFPSRVGLHRHNRAFKKMTRETQISARTKKNLVKVICCKEVGIHYIMIREVTMPCV